MKTTQGPAVLVVKQVPESKPLTVWRIVRSADPDDPVFLDSLRSHYELSEEPRKVERDWTAIHMGISTHMSQETSMALAGKWDRLGDYVARLEISAGSGVNWAPTSYPGHLTLWADPVKLRQMVVDIVEVDR